MIQLHQKPSATLVYWVCVCAVAVLAGCDGPSSDQPDGSKDKFGRCVSAQSVIDEDVKDFAVRAPDFFALQSHQLSDPQAEKSFSNNYITPTEAVPAEAWPAFEDDLIFDNMDVALDRQIARYNQMSLKGTIKLGRDTYPLEWAKKSLTEFKKLVVLYRQCYARSKSPKCGEDLNTAMRTKFQLYRPLLQAGDPRYGEENQVLFTGYYTPSLTGSAVPTERYKYAVYKKPAEEKRRKTSRVDIDFAGVLKNQKLEIFYTDDLFNLYLLHVQGGGHATIRTGDKSVSKYLTYDGTNGQTWTFISKYMMEKGMITDSTIDSQKKYLKDNPDRQEEIYRTCPSYVYFKESNDPPHGSDRVPLTDNRSIATDIGFYKFKGLLAFVQAERPVDESVYTRCAMEFQSYSRFYLDQDTGGAIKGRARADLYFGEGEYAEKAAYNLVRRGNIFFVMLKH